MGSFRGVELPAAKATAHAGSVVTSLGVRVSVWASISQLYNSGTAIALSRAARRLACRRPAAPGPCGRRLKGCGPPAIPELYNSGMATTLTDAARHLT